MRINDFFERRILFQQCVKRLSVYNFYYLIKPMLRLYTLYQHMGIVQGAEPHLFSIHMNNLRIHSKPINR